MDPVQTELLLGDVMHADGPVRLLANIQMAKRTRRTSLRDGSSRKKKRIACPKHKQERRDAFAICVYKKEKTISTRNELQTLEGSYILLQIQ